MTSGIHCNPQAHWAARYLDRMAHPFDTWEADCFRRGCGFLAKGVTKGAVSNWHCMMLLPEPRGNGYAGPVLARPLTEGEARVYQTMLSRISRSREEGEWPTCISARGRG